MDRLSSMTTFATVVDQGSFAAASRLLDVDQAIVTRQVAALEKHLGVKLLERTTRSMRLTDAGEAYLARCREILADVEEAEATVGRAHQALEGQVRLAVPTLFGRIGVACQLAAIQAKYPGVSLVVATLDRLVDPVTEGFDVVVADANLPVSPTAIARQVLSVPYLLCASPDYLKRHGTPRSPEELADHAFVTQWQVGEQTSTHDTWTLDHADGREVTVPVRPVLRANNYGLSLDAVRLGMGIGRFTPRMLREVLEEGAVQRVLPQWHAGKLSFNLIYPSRRLMPLRVRMAIDAILQQFNVVSDEPCHGMAQGAQIVSAQAGSQRSV
jgi:DNA-binding transcriptional LysR family regulator